MSEIKAATGVLRSDTFRLIIIYILPGGILVYPYYKIVLSRYPELLEYMPDAEWARTVLIVGLATFFGFILENVGSRMEVYFDSKVKDVKKYWDKYLATAFTEEPVGQHYMRDILLRMKFELHTSVALILISPTFWFILPEVSGWLVRVVLMVASIGLAIWLCFEAKTSHRVLHDTRKLLCDGINVVPAVHVEGPTDEG